MAQPEINRKCHYSNSSAIISDLFGDSSLVSDPAAEMNIIMVGFNYKTTAIELREKLSFDNEQVVTALKHLKERYPSCGFVLLSTCNRVELYCSVDRDMVLTPEKLVREIIMLKSNAEDLVLHDSICCYTDRDAVRHLLEVASSLDSLVLGESQIIAQVRDAYYAASRAGATDKVLNRLFHCAFTCSKEVYSTTSISQRRVSVASIAVYQAARVLGELACQKVVVVGVGEMGELIIRHLQNAGCQEITVVNRTLRRSQLLAERMGLKYAPWSDIKKVMADADLIIAAANAGEQIFDSSYLPLASVSDKVIIDIAVPRNFAPSVAALPYLTLYSIDDLAAAASDNMQARQEDIEQARQIINDDTQSFIEWFGVMDVGPMAGRLRNKFQQMAREELTRLFACLKPLDETSRQQIDTSVNRLVNKYLHSMVNGFYQHARDVDPKTVIKLIDQIVSQEHR